VYPLFLLTVENIGHLQGLFLVPEGVLETVGPEALDPERIHEVQYPANGTVQVPHHNDTVQVLVGMLPVLAPWYKDAPVMVGTNPQPVEGQVRPAHAERYDVMEIYQRPFVDHLAAARKSTLVLRSPS
jgi:hypothetical protein